MNKITVSFQVTLEDVAYLLSSAFEGGIGYWATIVDYDHPPEKINTKELFNDDKLYKYMHYPLVKGAAVILLDREDNKKYRLDLPAIEKGLSLMAEKYPKHFGDFMTENFDATTGDVFVQMCLLGDIVYG